MNEQKFRNLLDKYFEGKLTDAQIKLLHRFDNELLKRKKMAFKNEKHRLQIKSSLYSAIRKGQQSTRRILWRVAAGLLVLIGLGATTFYFTPSTNQESIEQVTLSTGWGQQQDVVLPDGTKVTLNAGSSISYPKKFSTSKRDVRLSGEAFFDVVNNTAVPFIIHTDEVKTTVLGTSFNINTQDKKRITITVATGKVRVVSNHDDQEVILTSSQQATFNPITQTISKREVNLEKYLDWKEGVLRFEGVTLAEASKKLEQWYNVTVKVLNNDIANCKFSGKFNNEKLSTVLENLKNLKTNMKYTVLENGDIEIKGTCN